MRGRGRLARVETITGHVGAGVSAVRRSGAPLFFFCGTNSCRAALDWADSGVRPYVVRGDPCTRGGARAYMSLMWVAMYHLLPKGSVTPPLRSP